MPLFAKDAFNDDFEDIVVPEGEYNLRVVNAEDKISRAGNDMIEFIIRNDDEPNAMAIFAYAVVPEEGHAHARLIMKNNVRLFRAFGLDPDTPTEDMVGATALTGVCIEKDQEGVNDINVLKLPSVKG